MTSHLDRILPVAEMAKEIAKEFKLPATAIHAIELGITMERVRVESVLEDIMADTGLTSKTTAIGIASKHVARGSVFATPEAINFAARVKAGLEEAQ
ncbi:hypothetical protein [Rhizobium sp. RCAM05973]|uniref:hypothetical protein n=1 Tax=Rhizobium sp. RCAM05973 TaxID=2994066 RepID=UPI0022EBFC80|nr:hypothetical protein [Rhizobium sp. RCAM05973]